MVLTLLTAIRYYCKQVYIIVQVVDYYEIVLAINYCIIVLAIDSADDLVYTKYFQI